MIKKICSPIQNGYQLMADYFGKTLVFPAPVEQKAPIIERVRNIPDSPDVPRLEKEIDKLIYDLYGLTPEEIVIVEGNA